MRVAVYMRLDPMDAKVQLQKAELLDFVRNRGWELTGEYRDVGFAPVGSRRPGLEKFTADAAARKFEAAIVWRLDRIANSIRHAVQILDHLQKAGVRTISLSEGIDTGSPSGEAALKFVGALLELERNLLAEKIRQGLTRARREGKKLGRPAPDFDYSQVVDLRRSGMTIRKIAKTTGLSRSRVALALKKCGNFSEPDQSPAQNPQ